MQAASFGRIVLLACAGLQVAHAQPADTLVTEARHLADFTEAQALAIDPAGLLYVVDKGRDVVVQLDPDGHVRQTYGGPGTGAGQFSEPFDIDPTNGLVWVVADAGNNRLQRFSRTFVHLESLPVPRGGAYEPGRTDRSVVLSDHPAGWQEADGRPVAVATSPANETFAVEAVQGVVLKWDGSRRLERVIGGYDAGEGRLTEPVALAADARTLYVADRESAGVVVYDLFGGYVRTLAAGRATDVQALTRWDEALWIVLPNRVLIYQTRGRLERVLDVDLGEPLVDAAPTDHGTYWLTATGLFRTP